jgi:small subunit ribosomal protein S8
VRNGLGIGIVSTSQGLLTDAQARDRRVGGELLCQVW